MYKYFLLAIVVLTSKSAGQHSNEQIDHSYFMVSDQSNLRLNDGYTDVFLVVDGERLPAHRSVLASRSDYFRALLYNGLKETDDSEVKISEVSVTSFKILLQYIYTGRMNLSMLENDVVLELFSISHLYCLSNLHFSLSQYLRHHIIVQNVCYLFVMARIYQYKELENDTLDFIDNRATEVLQYEDFLSLSAEVIQVILNRSTVCANELDIFRAVCRWIENNQADLDPDAQNQILSAVRYVLMSDEELSEVRRSDLVSLDTLSAAKQLRNTWPPDMLQFRGQLKPNENIIYRTQGFEVVNEIDGSVMIKLGHPSVVNYIEITLWKGVSKYFSYYIEVSMDQQNWMRVIDHSNYDCRSNQRLWIQPRIVKYIQIFGTKGTANATFKFWKVMYNMGEMHMVKINNGFVVPKYNVASKYYKNACIIKGECDIMLDDVYKNRDGHFYTHHPMELNHFILVQLAQPYLLSSMRMRLWDHDDRVYSYTIEVSVNNQDWKMIVNKANELTQSWQLLQFKPTMIVYIRITGVYSSVGHDFRCEYFEAPAQVMLGPNVVEDDCVENNDTDITMAEPSA
ncbi:BTB/POZ domain-containing protein 9-like [Adelges cooleyi]|uniref:BTB/POZ domain-containing protein 9-like n=1 Tax=Adelges cooleyi TaxID=133065 RepID=UPI00217F9A43|nr:BTB/POZ domain-containing protein 9-like [Adelges cooleyi]